MQNILYVWITYGEILFDVWLRAQDVSKSFQNTMKNETRWLD